MEITKTKNFKKWLLIGGLVAIGTLATWLVSSTILKTSIVGVPSGDNYFVFKTNRDAYPISSSGTIEQMTFSLARPTTTTTPSFRTMRVIFTGLPTYLTANQTSVVKNLSTDPWNVVGSESITDTDQRKYIALIDNSNLTNITSDIAVFKAQFGVTQQSSYPASTVQYTVELVDGGYQMHTLQNGTFTIGNIPPNAECGSARLGTYSSAPISNLCSVGNASTPYAQGNTWNWTCTSVGASIPSVSCTALNSAGTGTGSYIPQNVEATAYARSSDVFVRWDPVDSTRLTGYKVYRAECGTTGSGSITGTGSTVTCTNIYTQIGSTSGSVVYLDTTGITGQWYVYAISSIVDGQESNKSDPSEEVQVGTEGVSAEYLIIPYSKSGTMHLNLPGITNATWTSSNPILITVDNSGNIQVAPSSSFTQQQKDEQENGGIAYVTASSGSNTYGTIAVVVWPRGDLNGDFIVNAYDENHVAAGWSAE